MARPTPDGAGNILATCSAGFPGGPGPGPGRGGVSAVGVEARPVAGPTEADGMIQTDTDDQTGAETDASTADRPGENEGEPHRSLTIRTLEGELAAVVTITGLEHDLSPMLVDAIEEHVRREFGHLVSDGPDERDGLSLPHRGVDATGPE